MTGPNGKEIAFGIDLVSISRVRRLLTEYPDRFREFAFTKRERRYCDGRVEPAQHYAARWAAKEAYIKAIGGVKTNPDLASIEIARDPGPRLSLEGEASGLLSKAATARGTPPDDAALAVSLTHEGEADVAFGAVLILF